MAFIDVKRVAQRLNEKNLSQVLSYATKEGLEWMMLTNGQVWQAYHVAITPGQPVGVDLFLQMDLLDSQVTLTEKLDKLFYLTKEAFKRPSAYRSHSWAGCPRRTSRIPSRRGHGSWAAPGR